MSTAADQPLLRRTLGRMDEAWSSFMDRVRAVPGERLSERIGEGGWTRKQMLAHITTWHDLALERLVRFGETGDPAELSEAEDVINARAARAADGRTSGEIILTLDDSYRRFRREVSRLTDDRLAAHAGWAASIVAANSFDHYAEHVADLDLASPDAARQ